MLPHLVDLESWFEPDAPPDYDLAELVQYAVTGSDYWPSNALGRVERGVGGDGYI